MSDKISLRQILDLSVPVVLLVVASGGLVYAIKIAATLRDLRALEPVTLATDPETWRCPHATHFPGSSLVRDGEPGLNTSVALRLPDAAPDRVASCLPHTPQARRVALARAPGPLTFSLAPLPPAPNGVGR